MAIKHNKIFTKIKKASRTQNINQCGVKSGGVRPVSTNKTKKNLFSRVITFIHNHTPKGKEEIRKKEKKRLQNQKNQQNQKYEEYLKNEKIKRMEEGKLTNSEQSELKYPEWVRYLTNMKNKISQLHINLKDAKKAMETADKAFNTAWARDIHDAQHYSQRRETNEYYELVKQNINSSIQKYKTAFRQFLNIHNKNTANERSNVDSHELKAILNAHDEYENNNLSKYNY